MEQVVQWSDAMHAALSLEEHLARVLETGREAVGVDRLHLWAVAPTVPPRLVRGGEWVFFSRALRAQWRVS
jgi:hypothetical protein